ncbi:selenocysteine-specific translation elongation factor [Allokutzneria sp. NRRL B-24872]|uniref:selenocysteine-specific translation elongation factor n=1 Tax=Allokutzneria sp. NRRL B-24872 TaxID=1137961 RepID=UPI000A3C49B0|nr:selenocysteine-specific translation elongation factor [Allokutzneria sp. NRRL B-24872]
MRVIATAGHVDHGKSTLVRALTGMEPDRWAEERRRGLTIDLGFAWTTLADGSEIAFVDVPGHQKFVPNMLSGVGPVPAVMFVVAADEGWMPQSTEHLAALDALGIEHGVLVITRADLAPAEPALTAAKARLAATSLAGIASVVVSGATGAGLDELRSALCGLAIPVPDAAADVRLWVDRSFSVAGAGTVVTGTLAAGTLRVGDELVLNGSPVVVRGLQSLGCKEDPVTAVARVAVSLRGVDRDAVRRGDALLTPNRWLLSSTVDVLARDLPTQVMLHIGSAAVPARVRPLGTDAARLTLSRALPLRIGDRVLLRGSTIVGASVADLDPPALTRRGAARARAAELASPLDLQMRQRKFVHRDRLRAMGLPHDGPEWRADPEHWARLVERLRSEVDGWPPLDPGMPVAVALQRLNMPAALVGDLATEAGLFVVGGRIQRSRAVSLPARVEAALEVLARELRAEPFSAPDAHRLAELKLGQKELAAAVRAGRLIKIAEGVVLLPDALGLARRALARLEQPFTASQARQALGSTRRVVVPLLEALNRAGVTERLDGSRHALTTKPG